MVRFYRKNFHILNHLIWIFWAVLYALSFPTYNYSVFAWFAFVPVLVFAYQSSIRNTMLFAFFYTLLFFLISIYWLFAFQITFFPSLVPIYMVLFSFAFFIIAYVSKKWPKVRWLVAPVVWVSIELLRSSGYLGFEWILLGHSQWQNKIFIQSADLFGTWGISFLILLVNSVLAEIVLVWIKKGDLIQSLRFNRVKIVIVSSLFFMNLIYGVVSLQHYKKIEQNSKQEKVVLIQPNIGTHDPWWSQRWNHYATLWKLNAEAALYRPDMIVWSETMVENYIWYYKKLYSPLEEVNKFNERFLNMPWEFDEPIFLTHPENINGKAYNMGDYIDPAHPGKIQSAGKIHLVPIGEWLPLNEKIKPLHTFLRNLGAAAYSPYPKFSVIHTRKGFFAMLVCFEDLFPELAQRYVRIGVNYFINTTNDGWAYRQKIRLPGWQHLAGAVLTAIAVRRPIARAGNTGVTGIVHSTGSFNGDIGDYKRGIYYGKIPLVSASIKTLYVRGGYLFPYLLSLLCLFGFVYVLIFKKDVQIH